MTDTCYRIPCHDPKCPTHKGHSVPSQSAPPAKRRRLPKAEDVAATAYQILGALNAPARVLDYFSAIANGKYAENPLPFTDDIDAIMPGSHSCSENVATNQACSHPAGAPPGDALRLIEQLCRDLNGAHDEILRQQGCESEKFALYDWPEWTPQANSIRWAEKFLGKKLAKTDAWTMFPAEQRDGEQP